MAVGRLNALVTLDVSDPEHPREVGRLLADSTFRPHWMAKDPGSDRIVVGAENGGEDRMLMARLDPASGALLWDESFRSADGALGVSFVRERWLHGDTGDAIGHAALFRSWRIAWWWTAVAVAPSARVDRRGLPRFPPQWKRSALPWPSGRTSSRRS